LFFANKSRIDVILESCFHDLLGGNIMSALDQEELDGHEHGRIDVKFLKKYLNDFSQEFYVFGPPPMIEAVSTNLKQLGANPEGITFEK
jgi:ferredoxin-NADP reductase